MPSLFDQQDRVRDSLSNRNVAVKPAPLPSLPARSGLFYQYKVTQFEGWLNTTITYLWQLQQNSCGLNQLTPINSQIFLYFYIQAI